MSNKVEYNTRENLLNFVEENYVNIPIFNEFSKKEIDEFVKKGYIILDSGYGFNTEQLTIDKRNKLNEEYQVIAGYKSSIDEYGEDEYLLTTQMEFAESGEFSVNIWGGDTIKTGIESLNIGSEFVKNSASNLYDILDIKQIVVNSKENDFYETLAIMTGNNLEIENEKVI